MRQITKNILSRYSKLDLEDILVNRDGKNQAMLFDFDGTIHRGLWPAVLHGASYADLSLSLIPHLELSQLKRRAMCAYYILRDYRHMNAQGYSRGLIEKEMTVYYCNKFLSGLDIRKVYKAAEWLPRLAYRRSIESLAKMGEKSEITIISKTIEPIMESYRKRLLKDGLKVGCECNVLLTEDFQIQGMWTPGILCASDKFEMAAAYLANKERAVIFGNTSEDLAMHNAAEQLGIESIMIAVHPRDRQAEWEADVIMKSWPELYSNILR